MSKNEAGLNNEELLEQQNNDGVENHSQDGEQGNSEPKVYSEEEYKNAQSFGTKSRQGELRALTKLVQKDPTELKNIEDKKTLKTILESEYNVSSLEELEIINPNVFRLDDSISNEEEDDKYETLAKKVKLMEYKETKGAINRAISDIKDSNKDLIPSIHNFDEKLEEEMKFISTEGLSPKERVEKAFKIVANSTKHSHDAFLAMQGKTMIKGQSNGGKDNSESNSLENTPLGKAFFG